MSSIQVSELQQVPFINTTDISNRFIASLTFYEKNQWHMWIPAGNKLIKINGKPAESFYFAKEPENDDDVYLHFLNFIAQKANFLSIQKAYYGLTDDFYNLSASIAKLDYFYKYKDEIMHGVSRIVSTEIEYIFSVCRSVFDLLQEIITRIWENIHILDTDVQKKNMPESFSKAILYKGKPRLAGEFTENFGLPEQLDDFYCRHIEFFISLRTYRDNIAHRGSTIDTIFTTEKGFAIRGDIAPFSKLNIWNDEHKLPNNLCSLRPAIGYFIHQTLVACEDFSQTIEKIIKFPDDIVPEMHLFMRGYFGKHLLDNENAIKECKWWDT